MFFEANRYSKTPYSNNQRPFFSMRSQQDIIEVLKADANFSKLTTKNKK